MAHRRQLSGFGNLNGSVTRGGVHDDETTKKTLHGNLHPRSYFTEFTAKKAIMYTMASFYVVGCGLASMAEPFLHLECYVPEGEEPIAYPNASYDGSRCPWVRYGILLGMNKTECSFGRRLVMSILMGGLIGWERRQADRPAGIRTMSLVSLGSCLFTINSAFAFVDGPETWDASRISAAIPSGVGFLGAGLIFKKTSDDDNMVVHGLTTAASVWLSAAVGIACGGELYFAASFGTCLMMLLLRFGPRGHDVEDDEDDEEEDDDEKIDLLPEAVPAMVNAETPPVETTQLLLSPGVQPPQDGTNGMKKVYSMKSLTSASLRNSGGRERAIDRKRSKRANLGSIV